MVLKYLSVGGNCKVVSIDDIGDVVEESGDGEGGIASRAVEGEVDGVVSCEEYAGRLVCTAKVKSGQWGDWRMEQVWDGC